MQTTEVIALFSLGVSIIALYFAVIKETYRVRCKLRTEWNYGKDYISIFNNSKFPVRVSSVGYVDETDNIYWLDLIGNAYTGQKGEFPILVEERSVFESSITYNLIKPNVKSRRGYCIQLVCGRTYFEHENLPTNIANKYILKSFISKLTSGHFGFDKNYAHTRKFGH